MARHSYRIALYSHASTGLGHIRRNLLLANTLAIAPTEADVLLINGSPAAGMFSALPNIDFLTIPSFRKKGKGNYESRRLQIPIDELVKLREKVILSALEQFQPNVLIVDKVPRGCLQELDQTLKKLATQGNTRCILGLRDIIDEPAYVQKEWLQDQNDKAIREYYDAIWVYGDPKVYDVVREYEFPSDIAEKVSYTGYLDHHIKLTIDRSTKSASQERDEVPKGPLILCMVGGGEDGEHLANAFVRADLPLGRQGLLLTGPMMPEHVRSHLRQLAKKKPNMHIMDFFREPTLLFSQAEKIIAMGGYNTVTEVVCFDKPTLIVPRIFPRREQLIRAERFKNLGLLDLLHPDILSPGALSEWMAMDKQLHPPTRDILDMNGLNRLPFLLHGVIKQNNQKSANHGIRTEVCYGQV